MHQEAARQGLIHGDIKLENILWEEATIKVIDFGAAHSPQEEQRENSFTTIWYRAPELFFEMPYNTSVDMWSIGCVLFYMLTFTHVIPENSGLDAIHRIVRRIGFPREEWIDLNRYFKMLKKSLSTEPISQPLCSELEKKMNPEFSPAQRALLIGLITSIFTYENRISPEKALEICHQLELQEKTNTGCQSRQQTQV